MKKYIAELFGTFVLVFIGCGTVVFSSMYVGNIGIALAFGLAVTAMAYAIGPVSGAHINPAVSIGVFAAGRMKFFEMIGYIIFQCAGAALAAYLLQYLAVYGHIAGYDVASRGLGQNGFGENYAGGYTENAAIIFEFIATFIFVKVVLKTTESDLKIAGVVIGLTLAVIHILGLPIDGVSVNPARSFGPAVVVNGVAMQQLWLFLAVPAIAGLFAGICSRCCCCCKACKCGAECKCGPDCDCGPECSCRKGECAVEVKPAVKAEAKPAARPVARKAGARKTTRKPAAHRGAKKAKPAAK